MALSAGTVSLGVKGDAKGFGAKLAQDIKGQSGMMGDLGKHMGGLIVGGLGMAGIAMSIGSFFKTGFTEAADASAGVAQLAAGIKSTGNAAGVSVKEMTDLAGSIQGMSGQTDDSIVKAEQLLLTFTNIKNQGPNKIFDQATQAAADMAAKMGGDASSNAILLGKALNDPTKGLTALTRVGVSFTDAQKTQIAAMQKSGDMAGAQGVILKELQTEFGGAAKAAGESLPGQLAKSKRAFEDLSQTVVTGLIPIMLPAVSGITAGMVKITPLISAFETNVSNAFKLVKGSFTGQGADVDMGKWTNPLIDAGAMIRTVVDTIKEKASGLWTTLKPVFVALGATFAALAPTLGPLIPQVLGVASAFSPLQLIFHAIAPILPQLVAMLGGLAATLGASLGQALGLVLPLVSRLAAMLSGELAAVFQTLLPVIMNLVSVVGPMLAMILAALMPIIGQVAGVVMTLVQALMPVVDLIAQLIATLLPPIIALIMALLPPILAVVSGIVSFLVPILKVLIEVISWVVQVVVLALIAAFNDVMNIIPKVGAVFGTIGSMIKGGFNGVVSFVKGIFNQITGLVNGVIDGINSATSLAGAIGVHIGVIPHLPRLAQGATILPTPGGTIVRVAEAGRAETVVDTGKMNSLLDRALQTTAASGPLDLSDKSVIAISSTTTAAAETIARNLATGNARTNDNTRLDRGRRW